MTFYQWLKKQKHRNDGVGDLARDVIQDADWPHRSASTEPRKVQRSCERYLNSLRVSVDCINALHRAIGEYEQARNAALFRAE